MYNSLLDQIGSATNGWTAEINANMADLASTFEAEPTYRATLESIRAKLNEVTALATQGQKEYANDLACFRATRVAGIIRDDDEDAYPAYLYGDGDVHIEIRDNGFLLTIGRDSWQDDDVAPLEERLFAWCLQEQYVFEPKPFHLPKEWTIEEDDMCRWHVHQGKTKIGTYMTEEKAINAVKVFTGQ